MVRLKLLYAIRVYELEIAFTFHYGQIKTLEKDINKQLSNLFTFHYGQIKTDTVLFLYLSSQPYLHSTMVRLKLAQVPNLSDEKFDLHSTMVRLKQKTYNPKS